MQYAAALQLLAVVLPAFLAFTTKIFTGKKRFIIAIAAYFILKKWAVSAAESKVLSEVGGETGGYINPNALATAYKNAMNRSGFEWAMEMDGTNEDQIFILAAKSKGNIYKAVYNAYYTLYKRDLTKDLIAELSTDDYQKFLNILNA